MQYLRLRYLGKEEAGSSRSELTADRIDFGACEADSYILAP